MAAVIDFKDIRGFLRHSDPSNIASLDLFHLRSSLGLGLRSKTCNFVGNICRHTDEFYEAINKSEVLLECIKCLKDSDKNCRKFACFAVGNAGFHNALLYGALKPSIPYLVELLDDPEEKTRANAAGALGNFVRNSDELISEMISQKAVHQLIHLVLNDNTPSQSPRKIALFSIGNLCAYPQCAKLLIELNIRQIVEMFSVVFCLFWAHFI